MALNSNIISFNVVWEYLETLNELGKRNRATLLWIPVYIGVEDNEITDNRSIRSVACLLNLYKCLYYFAYIFHWGV